MTSTEKVSRISVKLVCPNPLFEKWLTEWRDNAKEKNSKTQHTYSLALQSLRKFPLPLETGRDCKILKGFGNKLCAQLDDALKKYNCNGKKAVAQDEDEKLGDALKKYNCNGKKQDEDKKVTSVKPRKKSKTEEQTHSNVNQNEYVPKYKSGPYALLVALYMESLNGKNQNFMYKKDLVKAAQPYSDTSFTKTEPGTFYSAWNSMTTLIKRNLVKKESNPAKYSLTNEGILLGHKLYTRNTLPCIDEIKPTSLYTKEQESSFRKHSEVSLVSDDSDSLDCFEDEQVLRNADVSIFNHAPSASKELKGICGEFINNKDEDNEVAECKKNVKVPSDFKDVIFAPLSFDVILYVDTQETCGAQFNPKDDPILGELNHLSVNYEVKNLKVGDYCWICRNKLSKVELILPYVIERKRMDDLSHSIRDGRFYEQKYRLKQCGLPNVIYMIETYGKKDEHVGLPINSLYQAASNTLIQDGFCVKFVEGTRGVAEYLACLSNLLKRNYENKTIVSCPKENLISTSITEDLVPLMLFTEFNKLSSKTRIFTVKEMFIRQLLQINGLSVEKALAIVEVYPTPQLLNCALTENGSKCINIISNIKYGKLGKKIGLILSNIICQFFTRMSF